MLLNVKMGVANFFARHRFGRFVGGHSFGRFVGVAHLRNNLRCAVTYFPTNLVFLISSEKLIVFPKSCPSQTVFGKSLCRDNLVESFNSLLL